MKYRADMIGEGQVPVVIRLSIGVYQCENHPKYQLTATMKLFLDKKIYRHGLATNKKINVVPIRGHLAKQRNSTSFPLADTSVQKVSAQKNYVFNIK